MMRNWKKWIAAGLLGTSILMAGCGQQAAVSHQAPLVKTVVVQVLMDLIASEVDE